MSMIEARLTSTAVTQLTDNAQATASDAHGQGVGSLSGEASPSPAEVSLPIVPRTSTGNSEYGIERKQPVGMSPLREVLPVHTVPSQPVLSVQGASEGSGIASLAALTARQTQHLRPHGIRTSLHPSLSPVPLSQPSPLSNHASRPQSTHAPIRYPATMATQYATIRHGDSAARNLAGRSATNLERMQSHQGMPSSQTGYINGTIRLPIAESQSMPPPQLPTSQAQYLTYNRDRELHLQQTALPPQEIQLRLQQTGQQLKIPSAASTSIQTQMSQLSSGTPSRQPSSGIAPTTRRAPETSAELRDRSFFEDAHTDAVALSAYIPGSKIFRSYPRCTPQYAERQSYKQRVECYKEQQAKRSLFLGESEESMKSMMLDNSFGIDQAAFDIAGRLGLLAGLLPATDTLDREASAFQKACLQIGRRGDATEARLATYCVELEKLRETMKRHDLHLLYLSQQFREVGSRAQDRGQESREGEQTQQKQHDVGVQTQHDKSVGSNLSSSDMLAVWEFFRSSVQREKHLTDRLEALEEAVQSQAVHCERETMTDRVAAEGEGDERVAQQSRASSSSEARHLARDESSPLSDLTPITRDSSPTRSDPADSHAHVAKKEDVGSESCRSDESIADLIEAPISSSRKRSSKRQARPTNGRSQAKEQETIIRLNDHDENESISKPARKKKKTKGEKSVANGEKRSRKKRKQMSPIIDQIVLSSDDEEEQERREEVDGQGESPSAEKDRRSKSDGTQTVERHTSSKKKYPSQNLKRKSRRRLRQASDSF